MPRYGYNLAEIEREQAKRGDNLYQMKKLKQIYQKTTKSEGFLSTSFSIARLKPRAAVRSSYVSFTAHSGGSPPNEVDMSLGGDTSHSSGSRFRFREVEIPT